MFCWNIPKAVELLQNNLYMDDFLLSAPDLDTVLSIQQELIEFLKLGWFELRKWDSNAPELLTTVQKDFRKSPLYFNAEENTPQFSILCHQWTPTTDIFLI